MPSPTSDHNDVDALRGGVFHFRRSVVSPSSLRHSSRTGCRVFSPQVRRNVSHHGSQPWRHVSSSSRPSTVRRTPLFANVERSYSPAGPLSIAPSQTTHTGPGPNFGWMAWLVACTALWMAEMAG